MDLHDKYFVSEDRNILLSEPATAQTKSLRSRETKTKNVQCANRELQRFQVKSDKSLFVLCFVISFILDVRLVDVPAGITQEEGHTGFIIHIPSVILACIFLARRIQPFVPLVDRQIEFLCTNELMFSTYWAFFLLL